MARQSRSDDWGFPRWRSYGDKSRGAAKLRLCDREGCTEVGDRPAPKAPKRERGKGLRLVSYRPLFSGPAIERIPELQFQRPGSEIELSADDAKKIGAQAGSTLQVRSNGTSVELRVRVNRKLVKGVARIPAEHAEGLGTHVEVSA